MNKIEKLLADLEAYIDGCKQQPFSNGKKIIVDRGTFDEIIMEIRMGIPEELDRSEKILGNREEILQDAKAKAKEMIDEVSLRSNQMVEESKIVQQAKEKADELLAYAHNQAQQILDDAVEEANELKLSSLRYTDEVLEGIQGILNRGIQSGKQYFDTYIKELQASLDTVTDNREQLGFVDNPESQPDAESLSDEDEDAVPENEEQTEETEDTEEE